MAQSTSSAVIVLRCSRWQRSLASPVMKLMYSDTHSWMVSLASSEILAWGGRILRMILITFAIGMNLSCSLTVHSLSSVVVVAVVMVVWFISASCLMLMFVSFRPGTMLEKQQYSLCYNCWKYFFF